MTNILTAEQRQRVLEALREYMKAPKNSDGRTLMEVQAQRDEKRRALIKEVLEPLVRAYLSGKLPLTRFKSEIDGTNKRHEYWGFKGIKGQMFFNMVVNIADDAVELDHELKAAISEPSSDEVAASRIKTFSSYVKRLGDQFVESGGSLQGRPNARSVPFFLSYFWQIQNPKTWPVFYTNSVQVMTDLNIWQSIDDIAADYLQFKHLHEELAELFGKETGKPLGFYEVEHVFWFKGGNPFGGDRPLKKPGYRNERSEGSSAKDQKETWDKLPDSYVPPIVQIIPALARNEESLEDAAKHSGTTVARALEKSVDAALTILGYETKLLGQGQGRVPDGIAIEPDSSYAIIWDAKARSDQYSMGTDDRTIREYIVTQSRELKRRRGLRNVYYLIISSEFAEDFDDPIQSLKMETDISEVILVESDALVAMVDAKLRAPLQLSLGSDGLQRLFTVSDVLTAESVRELMV
jgi:hypothetical protein